MPKGKVEIPTHEQVGAWIEAFIPDPFASTLGELLTKVVNMQSVEVDTGDEEEDEGDEPVRRSTNSGGSRRMVDPDDLLAASGDDDDDDQGISVDSGDEDDDTPAVPKRRAVPLHDDDGDDDDAPVHASLDEEGDDDDDDALPAPQQPTRRAAPAVQEEQPRRRGRPPRVVEPEPEPEEEPAPVGFEDFNLRKKNIKEYTEIYLDGHTAKSIKTDINTNWGIALKGTDAEELAVRAGLVFAAMNELTTKTMKDLSEMHAEFGIEIDYRRTKSPKTRLVMAARALVEAALENYEAP